MKLETRSRFVVVAVLSTFCILLGISSKVFAIEPSELIKLLKARDSQFSHIELEYRLDTFYTSDVSTNVDRSHVPTIQSIESVRPFFPRSDPTPQEILEIKAGLRKNMVHTSHFLRQEVWDKDIAGLRKIDSTTSSSETNGHRWRCIDGASYAIYPDEGASGNKNEWRVDTHKSPKNSSSTFREWGWHLRSLGVGFGDVVIKVDTVEERSDSALAVAGDAILDGETAVRFQLTLDRNLLVRTSRFEGKTIIETESSGVFEGVESSRNFANNGTVRFHNQFGDMNREMNVVPIEFKPILNRADFLKFADFSPPATAKVSVHDYSRIKKLESSESNSNGSLGLRFIALCVLFMILTCVLAFRKAYIQRKAS